MPAEELGQILQFCQPGTVIDPNVAREGTVGACKIYEFVTESGQNMGTVVEETVDLGNGTLATIKNFCTVAAGSGLATLTGIAAMPVTLTTATSIIAGILGITTGAALYASFPDFFNMVSDAIFGDAVDGLPVIFFDHNGNIRVAENTVNEVKEIALEQQVYSPPVEIDRSKMASTSAWLSGVFQARTILPHQSDLAGIADTLNFFDTYSTAFSDYMTSRTGFKNWVNRWNYLFNNGNVESQERRQQLLTFLNKYWAPDMVMVLYNFNQGSSEYYSGGRVRLIPLKYYQKLLQSDFSYAYNWDYRNQTYVKVKIEPIYHIYSGYGSRDTESSRLFPGNPWNIYAREGRLLEDTQWGGGVWTAGTILTSLYMEGDLSGNKITAFTEDCIGYEFITNNSDRASSIPGNNRYYYNDNQQTYVDYYDIDFMDPNGKFYVRRIVPETLGTMYHGYYGEQGDMSSLGIPYLIGDKEYYEWVYRDTIEPQPGIPVTQTYPNLDIITDPGIGNLIGVTPPELMPNPSQEAAQTSDPDANPGGYADFITDNISDVNPSPEPSPDPAPDPSPSPEPAPEPSPNPQPSGDDPVNPNVTPQPDPNPVIDPTLQSIDSSRLFTVYWLSANELDQLGAYLWSTNFITAVEKIWQDPMQAIISLKKVYAQPLSVSRQNIILGFLDSGVTARVVSSQFVSKSYGTISVKEIMHNATDYSPYSQAMIYLPFIGIEQIDIDDIMGGDLTVRYTFDLYTGICIAELFVLRDDLTPQKMLYTFTGNVAQDVPLTSASFQGFFSTLMSIASTPLLVGSGGGILAASHLAHSMNHELVHISHSGNLSANAGIMGNRYPQLILTNRNRYDAAAYNTIYGYPANKTVYLGNCSGYTKVKAIQLRTFATQDEKNEIEKLLKEGVIF